MLCPECGKEVIKIRQYKKWGNGKVFFAHKTNLYRGRLVLFNELEGCLVNGRVTEAGIEIDEEVDA